MNKKLHNLRLWILVIAAGGIWADVSEAWAQRAIIAFDGVKIYSLPLEDDLPSATLAKGDTVRVVGQRGEWVKIAFGEGLKGWMKLQVGRDVATSGKSQKASKRHVEANSTSLASNGVGHEATNGHDAEAPDIVPKSADSPKLKDGIYRRFGYSFGMGVIELDYTYNWKFVFHSSPRFALEGSFRHVLGDAADSYFIMANFSYLLKDRGKFLPYATVGMGVINTVPARSVGLDGVSNMAINVGIGARKYINEKLSLTLSASNYTAFVGKSVTHFREFTAGILVGKFWD
jgi:hypothetical protein